MVELLKETWHIFVAIGCFVTVLFIITEIARRSEKKKEKTQSSHESKKKMEEKS